MDKEDIITSRKEYKEKIKELAEDAIEEYEEELKYNENVCLLEMADSFARDSTLVSNVKLAHDVMKYSENQDEVVVHSNLSQYIGWRQVIRSAAYYALRADVLEYIRQQHYKL